MKSEELGATYRAQQPLKMSTSLTSLVGGDLTILKNISQWEGLSHILWKIKHV